MANFWKLVNEVINTADILLIVADARLPRDSINDELIRKITKDNKKFLIVFNKSDLLTDESLRELRREMKKYEFSMMTSAVKHVNTMALLRKLNAIAGGNIVTVGVVGYPNTGKSSIINSLKGRSSAPVSSKAGHTRGLQKIRATSKLNLLDTPGVVPYEKRQDLELQTLISSKNPEDLSDPEDVAMKMIKSQGERLALHYGIELSKYEDETLEKIAEKLNYKKKGNVLDTRRASVRVIQDWQKGKVKF